MKKINKRFLKTILFTFLAVFLFSCKGNAETMFDVTFNSDNGTASVVVEVKEGETVNEPQDPVKVDFTFTEWQLNGVKFNFTTPIDADLTLIAVYEAVVVAPEEFTVSFNSVGGSSVVSQTIIDGNPAIEPADPVKTSFVFENWLLNGNVYDFSSAVENNVVLDAQYTFMGIPDSSDYAGRVFNGDFDQLINDFQSTTLTSTNFSLSGIDAEQPYVSVGYSKGIASNPDDSIWKQAGSQNSASAAFQYLVLRLRGFSGASINDLSIGFRLDDNHEVLIVPFVETLDPDLQENTTELSSVWYNYVISLTDTLDGRVFVGKTGYSDVPASGVLVGFHLMNTTENGSGVLEVKDAFYAKTPNPVYPYEGSDYSQNRDYWFVTGGKTVGTYVNIEADGYYGEYLTENADVANTHLVLKVKQSNPGVVSVANLGLQPIFADGTEGDEVALSTIEGLPEFLGSGWTNLTIPFASLDDGSHVIAGYKLINHNGTSLAISQSFLSYLGDYTDVNYPLLDMENSLIFDNFNRESLGASAGYTLDNQVAIDNGFGYIISYSGILASQLTDGVLTLDSTGGDYVSYKAQSITKANQNEYRYLVLKYKLNDSGSLNDLRIAQINSSDTSGATVYANQWQAGLGLSSIPEDMNSYPYVDGEWTYLVVDLVLTEGYSTDFYGFDIYYTGSSISFDAIFFANPITDVDQSSAFVWADFEGLTVDTSAQGQVSENQYWVNVYDSPATIVADGEENQALQIDGTGYAQYHTGTKGSGRYFAFDLKVTTIGVLESFRMSTGANDALWAKDGSLILSNGAAMVVNNDGEWHHYVIDLTVSGLPISDTILFHSSDGEIYFLDNLSWLNENPYYDEMLVWGSWDGLAVGSAANVFGSSQYWADNYGSATSFVSDEENIKLKLDAALGYVQYYTGVMAKPEYVSFDIDVEVAGSLGINLGTHVWNEGLIGLDGNPIVLPEAGSSAHITIDVVASGLSITDAFGIEANDGAVFYIDNLSFEWSNPTADLYPVLSENFDVTPVNDGASYWWGEWALVADGVVALESLDYAALRFGSPLIANSQYVAFDVKLVEGNNADEFRLELGDGNIVYFSTLVADGYASELGAEFMTVVIPLSDYLVNSNGLQVLGFHINTGGVIIDNLVVYQDAYHHQTSLFIQE
ncbi:MAG: InlB B-repeat-containing protein [Acholeplasmataceae bacterium]